MPSRNRKCGGVHSTTTLSTTTAIVSIVISITTLIANGLLMFILFKRRKHVFKGLFYKIIFNIILADFLNGLIADNLTLNYVLKEGKNIAVPQLQITLSHITFFLFGSVSAITMGVLGMERLWALLMPFSYRIRMYTRLIYPLLTATWVFSVLMSLIYLWSGFYYSLLIFASVTVALSFIAMFITVIVYYIKLIRKPARIAMRRGHQLQLTRIQRLSIESYHVQGQKNPVILDEAVDDDGKNKANTRTATNQGGMERLPIHDKESSVILHQTVETNNNAENFEKTNAGKLAAATRRQTNAEIISVAPVDPPVHRPKLIRRNNSKQVATVVEKRATRTFIFILLVFIVSYLPTCIMIVYMNSCRQCNCILIHTLRDLTYLSGASGAFLRPINFLVCLKPLQRALWSMVRRRKRGPAM